MNEPQFFGKPVEWRETYRPVLAGPVDGRALYFALPLFLWPAWPETPVLLAIIVFVFWYLMAKKIEPDNVFRMMRSYTAGRMRWAVPRGEFREPKCYSFETPEMMAREREDLRKALEKADHVAPDPEDLPVRKLRISRCRMG